MQNKTLVLREAVENIDESKETLLVFLNDQINNLKKQHLMRWEGNHDLSEEQKKRDIKQLLQAKEAISSLLNTVNKDRIKYSIKVDIEL